MAAGQRIKTRIITRDIKTIDRPALMTGRVRRIAERGISAVSSEATAAFSDNRESRTSAEAGATEKMTSGTKAVIGSGISVFYDPKGRPVSSAKGSMPKAVGAAGKTSPAAIALGERRRVREYTVKDRTILHKKPSYHKRISERTLKQGRRLAQIKAAKKARSSAKKIRKASAAVKRAYRALLRAIRSFTSLLMSGGGVVLVIIIIIVIIIALVASPVGIFLSNDPGAGGMTTREAVQTLNDEFSDCIWDIEESNAHDELVVVYTSGMSQIDWKAVLAVYVARVNQNGSDSKDVISFDEEKLEILRGIMWDMNEVSYELIYETRERTVTKTDKDGKSYEETETFTVTILKITITQKTSDDMAAAYSFSANQNKALAELLKPEFDSLWDELLGGFVAGGGMGEPSKDRIPTGPFTWPLEVSGIITSFFGWREDPFTGEIAYHSGVDIAVTSGTPILAAADGSVIAANGTDSYGGGLGYYVRISHMGGYETLYAHCSAVAVRTGETVKQGQIIGYVGNTGRSKGPHLHWEVHNMGAPVDPFGFFR